MKTKNGFTLIELLAVIVILAVIALIAVPIVINIMNNARKNAAADTAYTVRKVAKMYYQLQSMTPEGIPEDGIKVDFNGDGTININHVSTDLDIKFEFDGTHPTGGSITIDKEGTVSGALTINGYNCEMQDTGSLSCSGKGENSTVKTLASQVNLGDYIYMVPDRTTAYEIPDDLMSSGYKTTFDPCELTMWRVISKNSDGTVDVVSDKISSGSMLFSQKEGYKNMIGILNEVAAQYTNSTYVLRTRHMGYYDQTEYITDDSRLVFSNPLPSTSDVTTKEEEMLGGGDLGYMIDVELVKNALGTLSSSVVVPSQYGDNYSYWLASRKYIAGGSLDVNCSSSDSENSIQMCTTLDNRFIIGDGQYTSGNEFYTQTIFMDGSLSSSSIDFNKHVRPILTLKSNINVTGAGTETSPYQLSLQN